MTGAVASAAVLAPPAPDGPSWLLGRLPSALLQIRILEVEAWRWLGIGLAVALALLAAVVLGAILRRAALRLARRTRSTRDDRLVELAAGPGRALIGLVVLRASLEALRLPVPARSLSADLVRALMVGTLTWAAVRGVRFLAEAATDGLRREHEGTAAAVTRIMVLRRVAGAVVVVVGGALVLLQFDAMRSVGTSLLASAGVAGVVMGLAAQRTLANLLAGLQISLAEPFRVGDVVVMEGEWGRVEEITLTYVVIKVWDLRRLVIPIGRVLSSPFQNWTRSGTDLLATVLVHADYRVPVALMRSEVERFTRTRPEWDGKLASLQVTDANDHTVELRALVSASDSDKAWDLRCALREDLVAFLQGLDGGRYLPQVRLSAGADRSPLAGGPPAPLREG